MCLMFKRLQTVQLHPQTSIENARLLQLVRHVCVPAFGFLQLASCSCMLDQAVFDQAGHKLNIVHLLCK
jgi:hypothetical protein